MRIKIKLSSTNKELPINNQHIVNSFIHRALGEDNKYHDNKNDYSISSLQGGKWIKDTNKITIKNGGYITITSLNKSFLDKILIGLYTTDFHEDIKVCGIEFMDEFFYNGWNHFSTLSPFIIKEYTNKKTYKFVTMKDKNFQQKVKEHLVNKLSKINPKLDLSNFDVKIKDNPSHKVKKVMVKNVVNRANQCQVSIQCGRKVAELIYNIGLGQSTGSGFGTIYKTENHKQYR